MNFAHNFIHTAVFSSPRPHKHAIYGTHMTRMNKILKVKQHTCRQVRAPATASVILWFGCMCLHVLNLFCFFPVKIPTFSINQALVWMCPACSFQCPSSLNFILYYLHLCIMATWPWLSLVLFYTTIGHSFNPARLPKLYA